jgi:HPt (histidine-containing phosphotransfer) domain-containing protein
MLEQLKQDLGAGFAAELIHTFLEHLGCTLEAVSAASARGDLATVAKEIHSLKGSSRQLEAEAIGELCEQIEGLAKEHKLREVQLLTLRLEEESRLVRRGLTAYADELSALKPVQADVVAHPQPCSKEVG